MVYKWSVPCKISNTVLDYHGFNAPWTALEGSEKRPLSPASVVALFLRQVWMGRIHLRSFFFLSSATKDFTLRCATQQCQHVDSDLMNEAYLILFC